ncbi:UxaA family hydrolase [Niabella insulamsoli]|uniref:UxaA family hydrolase n=1 Tax=Niabella insulamsoli TaxID=3144874 RepID=UPI0031FBD61A
MENNVSGYLRADGTKGIRNVLLVVYLVECAHHVSQQIAKAFDEQDVQVVGFSGCYPNKHADKIINAVCTHANVGAVLLVSLGCESFNRSQLECHIAETGRPVHTIVIQEAGGTPGAVESGRTWVAEALTVLDTVQRVSINFDDLIIGTVCGGSDATSGITANPSVGRAFDRLVQKGAICMFEETGEMIGLEDIMSRRAPTPALATELRNAVEKAAAYYSKMGHGSFAPGNAEGGLSTIEEKSMGAYCKSGNLPISGLIKPGDRPPRSGLYLMDVVSDGDPVFGFPNINDSSEIVEMIASGCHLILFTTGRGSVVGAAVSPVIKICANPDTYRRMSGDMDINAGRILEGSATIDDVGDEIVSLVAAVACGKKTKSEKLGHQEFVLTYQTFEPIGPACLPK